jgi:hypothetical protein
MVQSIQLNTCTSMIGDAENHDSSSEASNGNDEVLENENENEIDDDFDDEDADDKDVEEEEEAEADSPAAFLSPAPRAVKVTAAAKKDQDQKAIANANAKGQGKYSIPVDSMLLQSPFKKTWSRGNWTMEEDELLRAGCYLPVCLCMYLLSIYICIYPCMYVVLQPSTSTAGSAGRRFQVSSRTGRTCSVCTAGRRCCGPGSSRDPGPWRCATLTQHQHLTHCPCYPLPCIKDASGMSSSRYIHTYIHACMHT